MKKIFIFAAAVLLLASCDNNDPDVSSEAAKIYATIGESIISRATDQSWAEGDQIGISSIVGNVDGPYINLLYTTPDSVGNFSGPDIFLYKPMILKAYYPYTGTQGTAPGVNGVIEADTRIDKQTRDKQPEIDFLWDQQSGFKTSDANVYFTFAHKMSKVTFKFQSSNASYDNNNVLIADGVDVSTMVDYTISGLAMEGTFDTATGVCDSKPDAKAEDLAIEVSDVKHNKPLRPLILFPQTIPDGSARLHIYTNELGEGFPLQHYVCSLTFSEGKILPGHHYKYTIQVTKIGLIVGNMTIESWDESDRFIISTIDGNVFEK